MGFLFGGDQEEAATPAPPPPPPEPAPTANAPEGQAAAAAARRRAQGARGVGSTITTGPEGLVAPATTTRKSLLGE